jgi:dihydrodipicolinate synthase/N-acetylneuraminate lyase
MQPWRSSDAVRLHPSKRLRPGRRITGMSAVLLPYTDDGDVDWDGFVSHLARTAEAGLVPAVNMDTGFVNLIDESTHDEVLRLTAKALNGSDFVAGAFVRDGPGDPFDLDAHVRRVEQVAGHGGTPIVFPSHGLASLPEPEVVAVHAAIGHRCDRFLAFELGPAFVPFGRIYALETYRGLLDIRQCVGAKHSSLHRQPEWDRLRLRDAHRPDFLVLTGNDLAIDMVMYGSDYLLGLSTFAPDLFARRDALWAERDTEFYELNDTLQYLGHFAFRPPVPAYRHSAAQFLRLRGWIESDAIHPDAPRRPESDVEVLAAIAESLGVA